MKKILLVAALVALGFTVQSQNLQQAKSLYLLQKFEEANVELEKVSGTQTNLSAEAYLLKAAIYGGILSGGKIKDKKKADEMAQAADAALKKYRQLDPATPLLTNSEYQSCPTNLYAVFYTSGYNYYAAKNWSAAYNDIKKAVEYSDLLIQKKILSTTLDTNVVILAGIISENNGITEDAVKFYGRLADNRIGGDGFESVYRYLVNYYFQKNDLASFEKYKSAGALLYPKSDYFTFDKVDFAVGLADGFAAKIKAVEKILLSEAGSYKAIQVLGELIYDELNPKDPATALPPNAADLEKKMIVAFNRVAAAKPGFENPFIYMGDHFINKAVGIGDAKAKSLSDPVKTAALQQDYEKALFAAQEPYEKAAAIFSARTTLTSSNKAQYKKVAGYLADIASYKKAKAQANAAEQKKWADEEARWIAVADSVK